jgi:hypothetical protein
MWGGARSARLISLSGGGRARSGSGSGSEPSRALLPAAAAGSRQQRAQASTMPHALHAARPPPPIAGWHRFHVGSCRGPQALLPRAAPLHPPRAPPGGRWGLGHPHPDTSNNAAGACITSARAAPPHPPPPCFVTQTWSSLAAGARPGTTQQLPSPCPAWRPLPPRLELCLYLRDQATDPGSGARCHQLNLWRAVVARKPRAADAQLVALAWAR